MRKLDDIINDYAFEKMENNGLLLIPLPTGAGKSYTVFEFIHKTLTQTDRKDKIIFVTTLKKNLQLDSLQERFSENEMEIFNSKVLVMKSYLDCVLEKLLSIDVPAPMSETREYKYLKQAVEFCKKFEDSRDFQIQDNVQEKKKEIGDTYERNFRRKLKALLESEIKAKYSKNVSYKYRLDFVRSSERWSWILDLYPQILTKEKQVFLMSMDKFLLRNDPIIDKKFYIYKELAKDSIVFIDEFDATKDTILDRLIDNATKGRIDYVSAYKLIYDRLLQDDFPTDMTQPSQKQLESKSKGYGEDKINNIIPGWKKRAQEIYDRFNMKYIFKNSDTEVFGSAFLFQDVHSMAVTNQVDQHHIAFKFNENKRINEILYTQAKEKNKELKDFMYMIKDVRGFLKYFCGGVQILGINLMQYKRENGQDDFSYEEGITSILDVFFPGENYSKIKKYFIDEILLYRKNKEETKKQFFDASFIENGFSYYAIEDDNSHTLRSSIIMTSLESTPEKILLELSQNARVFGISATANYNSLIGNYALYNYIIPKLKDRYYELTEDENQILEEQFAQSISKYKDVNIKIKPISTKEIYSEDSWAEIFSSEEKQKKAFNMVAQTVPYSDKNDYLKNRYLRIMKAFGVFNNAKDIKSMLCLLTKFPDNKNELNKELLYKLFDLGLGAEKSKDMVVILRSGANYEKDKDNLLNRLASGEKIFVISTYQTIGAGQNLQYSIPEKIKKHIIQINDRTASNEKDFDAIYLDRPTNLISLLSDSSDDADFTKYIAQVEYLKDAGEITRSQCRKIIRDAFNHYYFNGKQINFRSSDIPSYSTYATKVIVQAVGRICRTNMKNKNIYICYDSAINDMIDIDTCRMNKLNPEFERLLNEVSKNPRISDKEELFKNKAETISDHMHSRIITYVSRGRNGWDDISMDEWQKIRKHVLQHPTLSKEEYIMCDELFKPLYIELPQRSNKVWFKREKDYRKIEVSFSQEKNFECVSEDSANLMALLRLNGIEKFFDDNGFKKSFEINDYIICPPVFTNIYKGALGEYAGRELLSQFNIELEEIRENQFFELFDYKVKNKPVYVDFKYWNEYSAFIPREQDLLPHIFEKLNKCNGKAALIINIFTEGKYYINDRTQNGITVSEIACLYDKNTSMLNKINFDKVMNLIERN